MNYAFAVIDESTFSVAQTDPADVEQYRQLTSLKRDTPSLEVFISIDGWSAGGAAFSSMASSPASRGAFIHSLQTFIKTYAFDGVDFVW